MWRRDRKVVYNVTILQGPLRVACSPDGAWKNPIPTCVCPACFGGDKCDQSAKWVDALADMKQSLPDGSVSRCRFVYGRVRDLDECL